MARPLIPFVQNGYYASRNWIPLVKGNGFTTSGGGEQEEVWETASGSVVTFDAIAAPLRRLSVAVEPVQNLNGYDNPWPAGGGKNILPTWVAQSSAVNGLTAIVNADGSVRIQGTATGTGGYISDVISFSTPISAVQMTLGFTNTLPGQIRCFFRNSQGQNAGSADVMSGNSWGRVNPAYLPDPCYGVMFYFITTAGTQYDFTIYPQLELGSTATSYAPYSNICPISGWNSVNIWVQPTHDTTAEPTATIQLGETVYGGTLDVVNGKMTVDRAYWELGSKTWTKINDKTGVYVTTFGSSAPTPASVGVYDVADMICSCYKVGTASDVYAESIPCSIAQGRQGLYAGYWIINDATHETIGDFSSFLNGQYICYKIATPFELTLTPEQISTLQGTNNVWSDAGDVTVEYRAR